MTPMSILHSRTVEIRRGHTGRQTHVEALCFGDWAAHRHLDDARLWVLTLLPLGTNLAPDWCSFRTEQQACDAMIEMARLKNSWSVIVQSDLTKALELDLKAIARKHGAIEGPLGMTAKADEDILGIKMDRRPNGYTAPL